MDSSKDDSVTALPTPDETPEPSLGEPLLLPTNLEVSPSPPAESLKTSANKKLHYVIVFAKEAEPKKKIDSNIREQNIITGKRIKK